MAKTIKQRIQLDGGKEIQSQLEAIGVAGEAAFNKLNAAANNSAALTKVGDAVAVLGTRFKALGNAAVAVGNNVGAVGDSVKNVGRNLGLISLAVGGAVAGMVTLFKSAGDAQEALQNTADLLGVTVEKYQALRDAAEVAGVDNGVFDKSILKLVNTMRTANQSSETYRKQIDKLNRDQATGKITMEQYIERFAEIRRTAAETTNVFKDLGVSITDANGKLRDPLETLDDLADAFQSMPNGTEKAAKSLEIFGTRNAKFGSFVNNGAKGIRELTLAAERLAPALDKDGRAALDRAGDAFTNLSKAAAATKNQILAVFAPDVSALVEAYTNTVVAGRAAWVQYAKTIEAQVKPIVNDIVAVLEGRDADVKNSFILQARDAFVQFGTDAKNAVFNVIIPAIRVLLGVLQTLADAINGIFGTKLTGGQIALVILITKLTGLLGVFTTSARLAWSVLVLLFNASSVLAGSFGVLARVVGLLASVLIGTFGAVPVAIAAVGLAIGFLVTSIVQKLGGVTGVINAVKAAFSALGTFIGTVTAGIGQFFASAWAGIITGVSVFVASVIAYFQRIPATVATIFGALATVINFVWTAILTGATVMFTALVQGFADTVASIVAFFTGLPEALAAMFANLVVVFAAVWQGIKDLASGAVTSIVEYFNVGIGKITGFLTALLEKAKSIFASIAKGAAAVAATVAGGGGANANAQRFATGGHVRGAGSGTSDSILARLSNGEYIIRAAAVKKFGVGFFNALNGLRAPLEGFAAGGLVSAVNSGLGVGLPRFATGGPVVAPSGGGGDSRPFVLQLGDQSFGGMTAPADTIDRLQRFATGKSIRSAGRKPSWFK